MKEGRATGGRRAIGIAGGAPGMNALLEAGPVWTMRSRGIWTRRTPAGSRLRCAAPCGDPRQIFPLPRSTGRDINYITTMRTYLGEFEQLLLFALMQLDDDAYGARIRESIEARTGRTVSPGAVYTALDRLESRGLVSSVLG